MGMAEPDGDVGQEQAQSAEQAREYVRRMRALPVDQVIGEVLFSLLNAAQVKLGRRDARLLIDVSAVAHEHARPYLPGELTRQIDQVLGQLRMGQVSAEGHVGTWASKGSRRRTISPGCRRRRRQVRRSDAGRQWRRRPGSSPVSRIRSSSTQAPMIDPMRPTGWKL